MNATNYKVVTFVPETSAASVRQAMGNAGAGTLGNYTHCSFTSKGTGRFLPQPGAKPAIGSIGTLEEVAEERIEVLCTHQNLKRVLAAMHEAHPYEEVAFDVIALVDVNSL